MNLVTSILNRTYNFELGNFTIDFETSEQFWKQDTVSKLTVKFPGENGVSKLKTMLSSEKLCFHVQSEVYKFKVKFPS